MGFDDLPKGVAECALPEQDATRRRRPGIGPHPLYDRILPSQRRPRQMFATRPWQQRSFGNQRIWRVLERENIF